MQQLASILAFWIALLCCVPANGEPIKIEARLVDGQWQLLRGGKPYLIKGIGGSASKELAAKLGANSFRTWNADDAEAQLDEAQRLGMTVCVGVWLGQERHHFRYDNADMLAQQQERVRKTVLKLRDHPALLCWALGNETEGFKDGDNAAIWTAINDVAALVHQLDPNHPTMTVISEVGGQRVKNLHAHCPAVDIIGINAYGGAVNLPQRYKQAGGTKPYILTEFGPPGTWETKKNAWGSAPELTSSAKADWYRKAYDANAVRAAGLCLGAYAFNWGSKQEATATWYGLVFPDGARTAAVDALSECWSGKSVVNHCPRIEPLSVVGDAEVEPGAAVRVAITVVDPENDPVKIEWVLCRDPQEYNLGGDREEAPPTYPEAIVKTGDREVELKMPKEPGGFRLFAFVRDDHGGGATANVPLLVKGAIDPASFAGKPVALPLVIFSDDHNEKSPYSSSGWMGKTPAIGLDEKCETSPHSGERCIRCEFGSDDNFGGVLWQHPANDWGDRPGGRNLTGAKRLTFWARGEAGEEKVTFQFGLLDRNKKYYDTADGKLDVTLTREWKQYAIDLAGKNLACIKTGFGWTVNGQGRSVVFYLDDIQFE